MPTSQQPTLEKTEKTPIILIGMPACGKSTVGVLLAKRLGYHFVDADLVIQERHGRLLGEMLQTEGLDGFIRIEEQVNLTIGKPGERVVIATGGSAVYSPLAMAHFRQIGRVVYIKISYEAVRRRLGNFSHRGVVMPQGYTLKRLYDERCKLYEQYAHVVVDSSVKEANAPRSRRRRDIDATLEDICCALGIE